MFFLLFVFWCFVNSKKIAKSSHKVLVSLRESLERYDTFIQEWTRRHGVEWSSEMRIKFLWGFIRKWKILLSFYQIISESDYSFKVVIPEIFQHFLSSFAWFVRLNPFDLFSMECLHYDWDYGDQAVMTCLFPIFLALLIGVGFGISRKYSRNNRTVVVKISSESQAVGMTGTVCLLLNALAYAVVPVCASAAIHLLRCDNDFKYDNHGEVVVASDFAGYLQKDYTINCASERYVYALMPFSVIMIFIFPIGVPLVFAFELYKDRKHLNPAAYFPEKSPQELDRILETKRPLASRFLWEAYKPECYYYEILETVRRLLLNSVIMILVPGTIWQILMGILICLGSIKVHNVLHPYSDSTDDDLAELTQWQLLFICIAYLLVNAEVSVNGTLFSIVLIIVSNLAVFLVFIIIILEVMRTHRRAREGEEDALSVLPQNRRPPLTMFGFSVRSFEKDIELPVMKPPPSPLHCTTMSPLGNMSTAPSEEVESDTVHHVINGLMEQPGAPSKGVKRDKNMEILMVEME
mmetsp:Transcript_27205/g.37367  ORF Transcript_27205/g.37367 Transcript_27205/m.37367 type:complete len:522 (-) Transcript_27205:400-1965(-)